MSVVVPSEIVLLSYCTHTRTLRVETREGRARRRMAPPGGLENELAVSGFHYQIDGQSTCFMNRVLLFGVSVTN